MNRILCFFLCLPLFSASQFYEDYIGAGHADGITITTSDELQVFGQSNIAAGSATMNGAGLDGRFMDAVRFLRQSTLGVDPEYVQEVMVMGYEAWLNNQREIPASSMHATTEEIVEDALAMWVAGGGDPDDYFHPAFYHFLYAWWQINMTNEDLLRQRVAYALSEIMVISFYSGVDEHADGAAHFYDLLIEHGLGNYRDLLYDVSLHPAMGIYLSHFNNPRTIESENIHPDENYAREIMQLFSIGLYELNIDGTQVLDVNGNPIASYGIPEVKDLARVFTGLGPGAMVDNMYDVVPNFGDGHYFTDFTVPMAMYELWHEPGQKNIVNGGIIPAGQSGMEDINDAIDILFEHPNVGPFLAQRLIQHMVKSNPTPAYVQRVATVFNDNGLGVRGDMFATVKAILMDEEARTCDWVNDPQQGKLSEPLIRYIQYARMTDRIETQDRYWNIGYSFLESTEQAPLFSRSVFNFFQPGYQPNGPIADQDLVAPEFQIHNSRTSLSYMNEVNDWTLWWALMYSWEDFVEPVFVDMNQLEEMAKIPEVLINHLDKMYTHGQMSEELRNNIKTTMNGLTGLTVGPSYLEYRARLACYLLLISPDYAIQK